MTNTLPTHYLRESLAERATGAWFAACPATACNNATQATAQHNTRNARRARQHPLGQYNVGLSAQAAGCDRNEATLATTVGCGPVLGHGPVSIPEPGRQRTPIGWPTFSGAKPMLQNAIPNEPEVPPGDAHPQPSSAHLSSKTLACHFGRHTTRENSTQAKRNSCLGLRCGGPARHAASSGPGGRRPGGILQSAQPR